MKKYTVLNQDMIPCEVEGKPVEFDGFEQFDFILHKSILSKSNWNVSEKINRVLHNWQRLWVQENEGGNRSSEN